MDRDDAGMSDRSEEARQGDTGMIGSESEEPGPGRDTSLTEPDPVAAGAEQPRTTVAMSEGDPMATRLGSHVEGAGMIGYDVAAAEEGATQATPTEDRPAYEAERSGYEAERPVGDAPTATAPVAATAPLADERDPGLAAEPVVDQTAYERVEDAGPSDRAGYADEPVASGRPAFATEDAGAPDRSAVAADDPARFGAGDAMAGYQEEPQRMDRPGGGGSLFTDEEPERLDRPGPEEPGVQEGVYDQETDRARQQRPSDGR
jgi:hypothetical protein